MKIKDDARRIAASLPIARAIIVNSTWNPLQPLGDRYPTNAHSYDDAVVSHAKQLLAVVDRFESNGNSFIPPKFKRTA
jgi:hypothetical protein